MVYFVGAGPGAVDLITVRAKALLERADAVIYAGSLVNPELLQYTKKDCAIYNSAYMTLDEIIDVMLESEARGAVTVRLHTGDPCLYGAIREQMDRLRDHGIAYEVCPGVSSFCAAAAALKAEYTPPGVSQSVIITRMEGKTKVPERERIRAMSAHGASMVLFLSTGLIEPLLEELLAGGYQKDTPAAIVYKASWPEETILRATLGTLAEQVKRAGIVKTALILVGAFLEPEEYELSRLYAADFSTAFREAKP